MTRGSLYAAAAYICWGLLPIYWKSLHGVAALEILAHRMIWSLVTVFVILTIRRHWSWLPHALRDKRILATFTASALLLTINWFVYIWSVNAGHVVDASLGYFINPLVNVLLGVLLLKEQLRFWQAIAIAVALAGVIALTLSYGVVPWIALILAVTFGGYGLLRKTATLNSLEGLSLETIVFFVPAIAYIGYQEFSGGAAIGHSSIGLTILLVGAGVVTTFPLLLFAAGARRIPMTTLGILQYIAPTIQFLLGILLYREPFSSRNLIGYCLIWFALAIYTMDGIARSRRTLPVQPLVAER